MLSEQCEIHADMKTVQQECIPQAILGTDVLCQAKSGMGKTAVFVLAALQQMYVRFWRRRMVADCL